MSSKGLIAKASALLFLVLLLASLGARFWAADRIIGAGGPTHITADGRQVLLFAAGNLFHLSAGGDLLEVVPIERIGLPDDPVDLLFMEDGSLLVAGQRPAMILQCDLAAWECRPVAEDAARLIERQLKVIPGPQPGEWFLTDARNDALWRQSPGSPPEAPLPAGTLAAPNGLAFAADGARWVADTNHRRIIELVAGEADGLTIGREHAAANVFLNGPAWYPMMLAPGPDGRWWVIQGAEHSNYQTELVIYHPERGAEGRVDFPAEAYPTDLAESGDTVLVTDMDRTEVYRVAGDSLQVEPFGDAPFRARLADLRKQRALLERVSLAALVGVVLFGILAILAALLATPREKRWTPPRTLFDWESAPESTPQTSGIHWLERNPATERSLRWAERFSYVLLPLPAVFGLAVFFAFYAQIGPEAPADIESKLREVGFALLLATALFALMIPLIRSSIQAFRARVGTDGRRLYVRRPDGREIAIDPAQLAYTDRMILHQELRLPLTGGRQRSLYKPGEVETWLAPLLRQARKLSAREQLQHEWRHRNRPRFWALFLAVALGTVLLAFLIGR